MFQLVLSMQYELDLTPEHLFNLYFNDGRSWESSAEISKQIWTGFAKRLSQDVAEKLQSQFTHDLDKLSRLT